MRPEPTRWLRSQMRVTWHLPLVLCGLAALWCVASKWAWLTSSPPRIVDIAGATGFELGLAHGRALSREIRELFTAYVVHGLVEQDRWSLSDLIAIGRHYQAYIPDRYIDEMRGVAAGAGIPYEHVLVMNTFAEAVLGRPLRACSAFAVKTNVGLLIGRNLDWTNYGVAHRYGIVLRSGLPSGRRVLALGWPGMVGVVTGMNDRALVVALNMASASDLKTEATPMLFRLRATLDSDATLAAAVGTLVQEPRTFAANVLVGSGTEHRAVVVELSGMRHAVVEMNDGIVVTTNHYQALPIRGGAGADRTSALKIALHGTRERTTAADARDVLGKVAFRGSPIGMITTQSVVFLPEEMRGWAALGKLPATSGRYYEIELGH